MGLLVGKSILPKGAKGRGAELMPPRIPAPRRHALIGLAAPGNSALLRTLLDARIGYTVRQHNIVV